MPRIFMFSQPPGEAGKSVLFCRNQSTKRRLHLPENIQVVYHPSPRQRPWVLASQNFPKVLGCVLGKKGLESRMPGDDKW